MMIEMEVLSRAARDVIAERDRQVIDEGMTPGHDRANNDKGQLASAAGCYAIASTWSTELLADTCHPRLRRVSTEADRFLLNFWPWSWQWWKPWPDSRRMLVKAGALILAEIERLDRAAAKKKAE